MNHKNVRKGFTLVEIMIVVVIIGLLAAMAIPAFSKVRAQSRTKAVQNNLRQFSSAAQQYMMDKGQTQAAYDDIVGTSTDSYLRPLQPVAGEAYTGLSMAQTQSVLSITADSFGTVTFSQ